ncbi:MAG: BlaI/MecI/CopY family transcriptional regulator [Planctomycetales bacterium]|nr:BlaI/MecI/CopY family transcriptional regulator [Planctomycetales bacterium]
MPENLPTDRELQILAVLWECGESTVREVYEQLRGQGEALAQNTVQAFLRLMTEKQLVKYRQRGRAFVYRAAKPQKRTRSELVSSLVQRAFDGAVDALVQSAFDAKTPSEEELQRLEELLRQHRPAKRKTGTRKQDGR